MTLTTPQPTKIQLIDINGKPIHEMTLPPGLKGSVVFQGRTFVESPMDKNEYYEVPSAA